YLGAFARTGSTVGRFRSPRPLASEVVPFKPSCVVRCVLVRQGKHGRPAIPAGRPSWAGKGAVGTVPAPGRTGRGKDSWIPRRVGSEPALDYGFIDRAMAGQLLKKFNY